MAKRRRSASPPKAQLHWLEEFLDYVIGGIGATLAGLYRLLTRNNRGKEG